jgi:Na+-transporting NADH:ubiquinone oxidoreductase subunit C
MQSNAYTLIFTSFTTIILGFLLSFVSTSLKETQEINEEIDIMKNILYSLEFSEEDGSWTGEEVKKLFDSSVIQKVVSVDGEVIENLTPSEIPTDKMETQFPLYIKIINNSIDGYAIPISGKGLWSTLYGYFALENDGSTVKGIRFYKHGETPGLGGEVEKDWFTNNFVGKRITDMNGRLVSIQSIKGQVDTSSPNAYHQVDGISGATMTTKGLNEFLMNDLKKYDSFFHKIRLESKG